MGSASAAKGTARPGPVGPGDRERAMPYCASAPAGRQGASGASGRPGIVTLMVNRGVRDFILLVIVQIAVIGLYVIQHIGRAFYLAVVTPYHLARRITGHRIP